MSGRPRISSWLRLQLGFATGGAAAWYAGVLIESDFVAGCGVGLLVAALALRFPRGRARDGEGE